MKLNYLVVADALTAVKEDADLNTSDSRTVADYLATAADNFGCSAIETASVLKAATKVVTPDNLFDGTFPVDEAINALKRLKRATR